MLISTIRLNYQFNWSLGWILNKQSFRIILILFLLPYHGLINNSYAAEQNTTDHEQFAEDYILQFDFGMPLTEVRSILLKKRDKLEIYNNCTEEFEYPMTACDKGYSLVTTIKLPDSDLQGRGDLQLYFTFNNKQQLVDNFYEIYYTEQHQ